MYDVMIVDDEEPVLDSFSFILEGVESFRLCGKARSGLEAIQLAETLKPDLIFMDIQMPGIDGLEAIRQIRESNRMVLFVLATAYERFDIARRAIQLNVLNYLVKPVTRKKIVEELERAKEVLDKQAAKRQFLLQTRPGEGPSDREELEFVRSLSRPLSREQANRFRERWNLSSDRGLICIIRGGQEGPAGEKQKDYHRIKEKLLFKYRCFLSYSGDRGIFFFPEEVSLESLNESVRAILREMSLDDMVVGMGGVYPLEELTLSYGEAMEPFSLDDEDEQLYELEQIGRVMDLVETGDGEAFRREMISLGESVFASRPFPVALGKMTSVFTLILERMGFFSRDSGRVLPFSPSEEIMILRTRDEWDAWLHHGLDCILRGMVKREERDLPQPLQRALEFIREEYTGQIYLGSVAEACSVSASYLSRLFSENLKVSFVDYLNRYRVDRAAEHLKQGLSVKEASFRSGFSDPNYFSKIFRKYRGISPSEFL